MKVFEVYSEFGDLRSVSYSLAVDPGLASLGLCFLDAKNKKFWIESPESQTGKVLESAMPDVLGMAEKQCEIVRGRIPKEWTLENTELLVEYTFLQGQFSVGLAIFIATLAQRAFQWGMPRIGFIPPRCPEWFLKQRSVSGTETVKFVRGLFPQLPRLPVHAYDALLLSMLRHHGVWETNFLQGKSTRKPEFEVIKRKSYGQG